MSFIIVSRSIASCAIVSSHMILDGVLKEGDPLPSVRNVAAEYRVNPLTVLKAYQELVDEQLVEMKRGLGMFVKTGARDLLLKGERQKFLAEEWPRVAEKIQRLGLTQKELDRCRRNARFQDKGQRGALTLWRLNRSTRTPQGFWHDRRAGQCRSCASKRVASSG